MDDKKPEEKDNETRKTDDKTPKADDGTPKQDYEARKKAYFGKLRAQTDEYLDKIIKHYDQRIPRARAIFQITGALVILGSVSLPFLAQMTTAEHKPFGLNTEAVLGVISFVSLAVALLTSLNSFFGWRFSWQRGVAVLAALEHYSACWKMDLLKAEEEGYPRAKVDAYLHTSYLYTQVFAAVSAESEAFFAELKPLPQEAEGHQGQQGSARTS
jgi:hypothetical protein